MKNLAKSYVSRRFGLRFGKSLSVLISIFGAIKKNLLGSKTSDVKKNNFFSIICLDDFIFCLL